MTRGGTAILVAALLVASGPGRASAQNPYLCLDDLSDHEVERETRRIQRSFAEHERHEKWWRFGWIAGFAAVAVAEFAVIAPLSDPDTANRWNAYSAGVGATLAMLQVAALPMPGVWARRRIERMPADTPRQRRERLRYALERLESAAKVEGIIHGPASHASGFLWGGFWGTFLTVRYDTPAISTMAYLGGLVINETRILTSTDWAREAWSRMRGGMCWSTYTEDDREDADYEDASGTLDEFDGGGPGGDASDAEAAWIPEPVAPVARVYPTLGGLGLLVAF